MCHSISIADMDCKNYTMDLFRHMDKYLSHAQICNQFGLGVPPRAKNICMFKPSADAKQTIVTFLPWMGISCFPVKPILVNFCMYHGFPLRGDSHQWVMLNKTPLKPCLQHPHHGPQVDCFHDQADVSRGKFAYLQGWYNVNTCCTKTIWNFHMVIPFLVINKQQPENKLPVFLGACSTLMTFQRA